jgi:ABC-type glycerol-3-phosphate transport system permease component
MGGHLHGPDHTLIASATATFLFRQFYMTIPDELVDAAKIDGSGPLRFLWSVLLPNSGPSIAALFVVMFIYGWNQYLWPLMATNSDKMKVVVVGIASTIPTGTQPRNGTRSAAVAMMALIPPSWWFSCSAGSCTAAGNRKMWSAYPVEVAEHAERKTGKLNDGMLKYWEGNC